MSNSAPAPLAKRRGRARLGDLVRLAIAVGLGGLTIWFGLQRPALRGAEAAFARKDARNAARLALDDLAGHPRSRASALIAAQSLSQMEWAGEAEPYYEIAEAKGPLPTAVVDERVKGLILCNRLDRAAEVCREFLEKRPDDPTALRHLAFVQWLRGRYAEAQATAERLAGTAEGKAEGLSLLATIHHDAEHPEQAIAAYEALLAIDPELKTYRPGPAIFWHEYTEALVRVHRYAEARDYLDRFAPIHGDPVLFDILGSARKELGDTAGAEQAWRESILRKPSRLNPRLQLGKMLVGIKRFADGVEVLEDAVKLDPENRECHYLLSRAYKFLGREPDSQRHLKRAEEIRRTTPEKATGMGPSS